MSNLINKIQALINKANSTDSQHEADALMSKAQQMMNENNLSHSDIDPKENEIEECQFNQRGWKKSLIVNICQSLNVSVLSGGIGIQLVGAKSDVELSKFLFTFYVNSLNSLSEKYYQSHPHGSKLSVKNSYCVGAVRSLAIRMAKQKKSETDNNPELSGIMHIKEYAVKKHIEDKYKQKLKEKNLKPAYKPDLAFMNGYNDGKQIATNSKQLI